MMAMKLSSTIVFLACIALILPTYAHEDKPKDYLKPHNAVRAKLGLQSLTWNTTLVEYAKDYLSSRVNDCQMVHSTGPYGENLAWSSGDLSAKEAVNMWIDEYRYYDYDTNSCTSNQMCGHYIQVVWRDTARLGCFKATCDNGGTLISCNYDPPGDYAGEWPY